MKYVHKIENTCPFSMTIQKFFFSYCFLAVRFLKNQMFCIVIQTERYFLKTTVDSSALEQIIFRIFIIYAHHVNIDMAMDAIMAADIDNICLFGETKPSV